MGAAGKTAILRSHSRNEAEADDALSRSLTGRVWKCFDCHLILPFPPRPAPVAAYHSHRHIVHSRMVPRLAQPKKNKSGGGGLTVKTADFVAGIAERRY